MTFQTVALLFLVLTPALSRAQEKSDVSDRIRRLPATLLATKKSDGEITDAMFLAIIIRLPTDDEKARVTKMFATRGKREHAVEELRWVLVNTKEFAALDGLTDITAAPAGQEFVPTVLGPKAFRHGDAIEITSVWATSPRLEPGDSVTVRGRVRLASRDQAQLGLYVTQTTGDGKEAVDRSQVVQVARGQGQFKLQVRIKHRGALHLTLYDDLGRPIGGVYFGTPRQMRQIEGWSLDYYLGDSPPDKAQQKKTGKAKPELPDEQRNQIALLEVMTGARRCVRGQGSRANRVYRPPQAADAKVREPTLPRIERGGTAVAGEISALSYHLPVPRQTEEPTCAALCSSCLE